MGAYLRLISITDTYTLHNFPHVVQVWPTAPLVNPVPSAPGVPHRFLPNTFPQLAVPRIVPKPRS